MRRDRSIHRSASIPTPPNAGASFSSIEDNKVEKKQKINLIRSSLLIPDKPEEYMICLHINNMIATYGKTTVLDTIYANFFMLERKR